MGWPKVALLCLAIVAALFAAAVLPPGNQRLFSVACTWAICAALTFAVPLDRRS